MRATHRLISLLTALICLVPAGRAQDQDALAGQLAVCAGCHGEGGTSIIPGIPSLAGQHYPYLIKSLKEFRQGVQHAPVMSAAIGVTTPADLPLFASYYAAQPYVRNSQSVDAVRAGRGKAVYESTCSLCHTHQGRAATHDDIPLLAGQDLGYLLNEVDEILNGVRHVEMLKTGMIRPLGREEIIDAIHYFAGQQVTPDQVSTSLGDAGKRHKRGRGRAGQ